MTSHNLNLDELEPIESDRTQASPSSPFTCQGIIAYLALKLRALSRKQVAKEDEMCINIAKTATFQELTEGYYFTTKWQCKVDRYGTSMQEYSVGEENTEWVEMNRPRPCSYQKQNKTIPIEVSSSTNTSTTPPAEYRGITLRQLRAVMANITRRCEEEGWKDFKGNVLTAENVTLYDAEKYVIRPFTVEKQQSFVTCLPSTAGPQPPRFFVSHWWGEPVKDFVHCVEQFVRDFGLNLNGLSLGDLHDRRGGGMTADTPVWVCAYANDQWHLDKDITQDPKESGFTKAMRVAEGRTITILDKEGDVFSRIWCVFELFLTLVDTQKKEGREVGVWAVYTAHPHTYAYRRREEQRNAVGIVSGGATDDRGQAVRSVAREISFPFELISKSLTIKVENAIASIDADRIHILNSIVGNTGCGINDTPPITHEKYTAVNDALHASFALSIATLQAAMKQGDEVWESFLLALSKGEKEVNMEFRFGDDGWIGLTEDRAIQLVSNIPLSTRKLSVYNATFGIKFMKALTQRIDTLSKLIYVKLYDILVDGEREGQEAGVLLAKVLASNNTIISLSLFRTNLLGSSNVIQWGDALMENNILKQLRSEGVGTQIREKLKERTKDRRPKLGIY